MMTVMIFNDDGDAGDDMMMTIIDSLVFDINQLDYNSRCGHPQLGNNH